MAFSRKALLYLVVYAALLFTVYFIVSFLKSYSESGLSLDAIFFKEAPPKSREIYFVVFILGALLILATAIRAAFPVLFSNRKRSYQISETGIQRDAGWSFPWGKITGYSLISEISKGKPVVLILHTNERQVSLPLPEDDKLNPVLSILSDKSVLIEEALPKSLHAKFLKRAQSSKNA